MRPILIVNPVTDRAFGELAESMLDEAATVESFQAALRATYPDVLVRARELSGEARRVWYVYRDGRWTRPSPEAR